MNTKKRKDKKCKGKYKEQRDVPPAKVDDSDEQDAGSHSRQEDLYGTTREEVVLVERCQSPYVDRKIQHARCVHTLDRCGSPSRRSASPANRCASPLTRSTSPFQRRVSEPSAERCASPRLRCASPLERRVSEIARRCASPPPPVRHLSELTRCVSPTSDRSLSDFAARCASPPPPKRGLSQLTRSTSGGQNISDLSRSSSRGQDISELTRSTSRDQGISEFTRNTNPPSPPTSPIPERLTRPSHLCLSPPVPRKMSQSPSYNLLYELPFRKEYEISSISTIGRKEDTKPTSNIDLAQHYEVKNVMTLTKGKDGLYRTRSESPSRFFRSNQRSESPHAILLQKCDDKPATQKDENEQQAQDGEQAEEIYESIRDKLEPEVIVE